MLCIFFLPAAVWSQSLKYELTVEQEPLSAVITLLEKEYNFLFSYKEEDVLDVDITATIYADSLGLFLTQLFKPTGLDYQLVNERYILLTKNASETQLNSFRLCGRVVDELTNTALSFANIYIDNSEQGEASGEDGSFDFTAIFSKRDSLVISYVGYAEKKFLATDFVKKNCPDIVLNILQDAAQMVVVTDYLTDGISLGENGAQITLRPDKVSALPGQSEPDVLKTIQFLPGVSSLDGSAANLSIRGSTADQNLILWEDIPIYHSGHYFGMISAFNPYIINQVDVYRGGFDAAYGGRIAGLIDLKSKPVIGQEAKIGAGVNFLNGYIYGNVPLWNKKVNIIFSARRSFAELWRSPTFENITRRIHQGVLLQLAELGKAPDFLKIDDDFSFSDANIKATFQITDKDKVDFAALYGNNDFEATILNDNSKRRQADDLYLENMGWTLNWKRQWSPSFSTRVMGINSDYHYNYDYEVNTQNQNTPDKNGIKSSQIKEQQMHLAGSYTTEQLGEFELGAKWTNYEVAYEITRASRENGERTTMEQKDTSLQIVYAAYRTAPDKKWGLEAGLRFTNLAAVPQAYWEPRLRLWFRPNAHFNVFGSAGRYYQFISQLIEIQGDNASIDTPVWVLAGNKEVPVLNALQFQLGAVFNKNSWVLDVQAYKKKVNGLSSLSSGFDDDLGDRFLIGEADISGLDILLKKRWGKFQNWISYSLSDVNYHFDEFFDPEFPSPTEQPHAFHIVNVYKHGPWECSLGWKISSGRPYSLLQNFRIKINPPGDPGPIESIEPIVNEFNSARLPVQHQLDASVQYRWQPKNSDRWNGLIGFSLFNIYHQNNIYQRNFLIENLPGNNRELRYSAKSDLGFTPNLTLRIEW